jgi:hypothetical protein
VGDPGRCRLRGVAVQSVSGVPCAGIFGLPDKRLRVLLIPRNT